MEEATQAWSWKGSARTLEEIRSGKQHNLSPGKEQTYLRMSARTCGYVQSFLWNIQGMCQGKRRWIRTERVGKWRGGGLKRSHQCKLQDSQAVWHSPAPDHCRLSCVKSYLQYSLCDLALYSAEEWSAGKLESQSTTIWRPVSGRTKA